MKAAVQQFTPDNIEKLKKNEVFVFGSNLNGNHAGGAARIAVEKFGAIEGQPEGLQGESYAIPTLGEDMQKLDLSDISKSLDALISFAEENAGKTFLLTKIGCGIAGFKENEIAKLCLQKTFPSNVILPERFTYLAAYKGMYKDAKGYYCSPGCLGKRHYFEAGKEYHADKAIACDTGYHACIDLHDVSGYYPVLQWTAIAEVELRGEFDFSESDKVCATDIRIIRFLDWSETLKGFVESIKDGVNRSKGVNRSYGVNRSNGVNGSKGVNGSYGVNRSYGIHNCFGASDSFFDANRARTYSLFGKEVTEGRYNEVRNKYTELSDNFIPEFTNLKGLYVQYGSDWKFTPVQAAEDIQKEEAWGKMPEKAIEYLKSLPEFDAEIFFEVTGIR